MLHGFDILNDGRDIGDCYSILLISTTVKIEDENNATISAPPVDIYEGSRIKFMRRD
ncbi:MAG: hypothetical protein IH593_03555 [Bacteroidales bacterium]|nr:hypothetical protein [Bacteroidales bacterium]